MANRKPTPIGENFHYLTVIGDAPHKGKRRCVSAQCVCGSIKDYVLSAVMSGRAKSCGCKIGSLKAQTLREKLGPQFIGQGDIATAAIGGNKVLVDADRAEEVNQHRWMISGNGYCVTSSIPNSPPVSLHKFIMPRGSGGSDIDHISGDKLDNRSANLRRCSHQENMWNMSAHASSTSQYRGVSWDKNRGKWAAYLKAQGGRQYLGRFTDEQEAARAYDEAAKVHYGEFARLNFP